MYSVYSLSFSPDGTHIITSPADCTVQLWDAATEQPVGEPLRGHTDLVKSVSFSSDGTRIVTGSDDHTVRLWDVATGKPVSEPLLGHTDSVVSVSFSPDGTRIVSGSHDCTVRLWDAATGQPVGEPLRGHTGGVTSVSFSSDGTRIVTGSYDHTIRLWDVATGQPVGEPLRGHTHSEAPDEFAGEVSGDESSSTPFVLNVDSGWVVGPKCRLLFWVPPASRPSFWSPRTALVIPRGIELDLSHMTHGQHWQMCRGGSQHPSCSLYLLKLTLVDLSTDDHYSSVSVMEI
ncbi:WD40 repeat-like protein [Suillus decipiens]|nr:WD40 repeat-like protein [Suillus decipiens]